MTDLFPVAVATLLEVEGGVSDHPDDPGGVTNMGISLRAYPHLGREGILNLTRDQAISIYREDYWDRIPSSLPDAVRWFAFDSAVNHGVARALGWLKIAPALDGLVAIRLRFYANLTTFDTFGRGWTRRVAHVLDAIDKWTESTTEGGTVGTADTLVLHNLRLADRWVALTANPVTLRGSFPYRIRGSKLDVRRG